MSIEMIITLAKAENIVVQGRENALRALIVAETTPEGLAHGTDYHLQAENAKLDTNLHTINSTREIADGSGTGRYGAGHDNWTQTGDGTDYPGSYGVGPQPGVGSTAQALDSEGRPLKPFVPYTEPANDWIKPPAA